MHTGGSRSQSRNAEVVPGPISLPVALWGSGGYESQGRGEPGAGATLELRQGSRILVGGRWVVGRARIGSETGSRDVDVNDSVVFGARLCLEVDGAMQMQMVDVDVDGGDDGGKDWDDDVGDAIQYG